MLESFGIIFISILLEALPFVILGTVVSSLIEVFISTEWIEQRFRNKHIGTYLLAGLIGIIFPVCECAIVPIMRRLVKKGMPLSLGITFMLATPIVNPVVLLSTYYAFNGQLNMVFGRGVFGFIAAVLIGLIITRYDKKVIHLMKQVPDSTCACGHDHGEHNHTHEAHDHSSEVHQHHSHDDHGCDCGHNHSHDDHQHQYKKGLWETVKQVIEHTGMEVIDVGKYLIFGALITSAMQTFVSRDIFMSLSSNKLLSILLMMALAFILSLCSEADAFIASSFSSQFPPVALMAFMVFGPMIDIKNTMMLMGSFKKAFVVRLIAIITLVVVALMALIGITGILG